MYNILYLEVISVKKQENINKTKTIAVLLDLEGTSDFIDDQKAQIFIQQLDVIRQKFGAELGTISISTHFCDSNVMRDVLEILARNTTDNIKIGYNFYYGGIYDFTQRIDIPQRYGFNEDKVATFDSFYVNNIEFENQWFALIDDRMSETEFKKYQNSHPMLLCRPSQHKTELKYNCFMNVSTTINGFDGVLEAFDIYIDSISGLTPSQVLETQKNMLVHLSSHELADKIMKRDYLFVDRYFREGYADETDYRDALSWISFTNTRKTPTKEELVQIRKVLELIAQNYQINNDENGIERVKKIQADFTKNN